jgi:hypothetical protein
MFVRMYAASDLGVLIHTHIHEHIRTQHLPPWSASHPEYFRQGQWCTYMHTYMYIYIHTYTHTPELNMVAWSALIPNMAVKGNDVHTCICICIYIYIHTHTHQNSTSSPGVLSSQTLPSRPSAAPAVSVSVSAAYIYIYIYIYIYTHTDTDTRTYMYECIPLCMYSGIIRPSAA